MQHSLPAVDPITSNPIEKQQLLVSTPATNTLESSSHQLRDICIITSPYKIPCEELYHCVFFWSWYL